MLKIAVTILMVISPAVLFAESDISFNLSKHLQVLVRAQESVDSSARQVVGNTIDLLVDYPYKETVDGLIIFAAKELERGSEADYSLLDSVFSTIEQIGAVDCEDKLRELQKNVNRGTLAQQLNDKARSDITGDLEYVIGVVRQKSQPLLSVATTQLLTLPKPVVQERPTIITKNGVRELIVNGGRQQFLSDVIKNLAQNNKSAAILLATVTEFLNDSVLKNYYEGKDFQIEGREEEADKILSTLVRIKGKNPVLVGPSGAGKTSIVQRVAQILTLEKNLPSVFLELKDALIIETTPAKISSLDPYGGAGNDINQFFSAVKSVETTLRKPIIVFIDELHTLTKHQVEALKAFLDSTTHNIKLIGATSGTEFNMAFKRNDGAKRRFQLIEVREFSFDETTAIIQKTWQQRIQNQYDVNFSPEAVRRAVEGAKVLMPDTGLFDGAIKVLQDISILMLKSHKEGVTLQISESDMNQFLQSRLGFPVNSRDARARQEYRSQLLADLKSQVVAQEAMIEDSVDLWMELLNDTERTVRVQTILGPTGSGKTELGRALAKKLFKREGAFLEVDANAYKGEKGDMTSLLGVANGYIDGDKTSGVLIDYLEDPARGKFGGVILINEAERMAPAAWERLMELLDVGLVTGGDGKTRKANRHLIILTSNRGSTVIYPPGIEKLMESEMETHIRSFDDQKLRDVFRKKVSSNDKGELPDPIIARIDKWSLARPITLAVAQKIAANTVEKVKERLEKQYRVKLKTDNSIADTITNNTFQYGMGARPVVRAVSRFLSKLVPQAISELSVQTDQEIIISGKNVELEASISGKSTTIALAQAEALDPLDDPEFAKKMNSILPELREKVIGQDEATEAVARAVIAQKSDPTGSSRPISIFMVGSTGTGKTLMGKSLAKTLFKDENRVETINLGEIFHSALLNEVFNAPKGNGFSEFEEILVRNPEGGVIIFDEASNMGGEDMARKASLFKQGFYSILDEGKWTSKTSGKIYDLSKFVFLFTGNDGEKLFQGIDADDLRIATYKKNKDRVNVQKLLIAAGVPEAFLGRLINVILMKPLLKKEVESIVLKMLDDVLKSYKDRGVRFEFDPNFVSNVARSFYSHDQGARSIRNMLDSVFKSALANLIVQSGGIKAISGQTIKLSLIDNLPQRPFYTKNTPERSVGLRAEIHAEAGKILHSLDMDVTSSANKVAIQSFKDARATAIHEAGHAIVNQKDKLGYALEHLTIIGSGNYLGYARYEKMTKVSSQMFDRDKLVAHVAKILAGQLAQEVDNQPIDSGRSGDLDQIRKLISESLLKYGLIKELDGILYQDGKLQVSAKQRQIVESETDKILNDGRELSLKILKEKWPLVRHITAVLLKKGYISGKEFYEIVDQFEKKNVLLAPAPSGTAMMCRDLFLKAR